jgi:hypothetical protein
MGLKKARVANLPPERPMGFYKTRYLNTVTLRGSQTNIGPTDIHRTESGIRLVEIHLREHIPSRMWLGGTRVLMSYEDQPATCYGCGGPGHQYTECPARRKPSNRTGAPVLFACLYHRGDTNMLKWADVVHGGIQKPTTIDSTQIETGVCPTTDISPTESCTMTPGQVDGRTSHAAPRAENEDSLYDRVPKGDMSPADREVRRTTVSPEEGPKELGEAGKTREL